MLTPISLATWIAFCIPWAEPHLANALVVAGSNADPFLIADASDTQATFNNVKAAITHLRQRLAESGSERTSPQKAIYVGLTQIPTFALDALGIDPEVGLDKCANLEIGYSLFLESYDYVGKTQKSPWKRTAAAFSYYRTRQMLIDSPYAKRATDYLMAPITVQPAQITDPTYHAVASEWSAGIANRAATRTIRNSQSVLNSASDLAQWGRNKY